MMHNKEILKNLLSLSMTHLQLAFEENWVKWEQVANRKEYLYGELEQLKNMPLDDGYRETIREIKRLEEQTKEQIDRKKKETKLELEGIKRAKGGLKGYRRASKDNSGRHGLRVEA